MALKACKVRLRILVCLLQDSTYWVNIHHLEYTDGGILDPDDVLADVVEDKDKVEWVKIPLLFAMSFQIINATF